MRTKHDPEDELGLDIWIWQNAERRRELMWLDHMGKGERDLARDLEAHDPKLVARLRERYRFDEDEAVSSDRTRRAQFHDLWSVHYAFLALRYGEERAS